MSDKEAIKDKPTKVTKTNKLNVKTIAVALLLVFSFGAAIYFWNDAQNAKSTTPDAIAAKNLEESSQIVSQLSQIILIKSEEDPTVARVEDPDTLIAANADFYADVQAGDYLVLYPQRAIIYRTPENTIINIAPIIDASRLNNDTSTPAPDGTSETDQ